MSDGLLDDAPFMHSAPSLKRRVNSGKVSKNTPQLRNLVPDGCSKKVTVPSRWYQVIVVFVGFELLFFVGLYIAKHV